MVMNNKIKRMFQVYWMLFLATEFLLFAIYRQMTCECLYLTQGGVFILVFISIFVVLFTSSMRKSIKR